MYTLQNHAWWLSSSFPKRQKVPGWWQPYLICGFLKNQQDITYIVATQNIFNELIYLPVVSGMNHSALPETMVFFDSKIRQ